MTGTMPPVEHTKTSLEQLPACKRDELARVQEIVFEEFRTAVPAHPPAIKKPPEILKIVLFGAYARGDCVDEPASKSDCSRAISTCS